MCIRDRDNGLLLNLHGPDGATRSLRVAPRIVSNNQLSIQQMCEAGLGLALMGSVDVQDALQTGRLVRLLPQWNLGTLGIWAVTPQRDAQPAKVRQAIAALHSYLVTLPGVRACRTGRAGRAGRVTRKATIPAVSYTHLDVYKRQCLHGGRFAPAGVDLAAQAPGCQRPLGCLLYTSRCV